MIANDVYRHEFKHEWRFEQDTGFIYAVTNGRIELADAVEFIRLFERDVPRGAAAFMLGDNRRATEMSLAARRAFASDWKPGEMYIAAFGQSAVYRIILNMFLKGLSIIRPNFTAAMFAEEAEAREWLTEKRRAYLARKARGATTVSNSASPP
ncbi:MAG TPA: hypothetical protein VM580_33715 [Labilithrix sp.]|nr:hypothetical protein [Labilithrix sp.]